MQRLPPSLVRRLRSVAPRLLRMMTRLVLADPRHRGPGYTQNDYQLWGGRVRQLNVGRRKPTPIILKWVHPPKNRKPVNARIVLSTLRRVVQSYRKKFKEHMEREKYVLVHMPAIAISPELIAMSRIRAPTIEQLYMRLPPATKAYAEKYVGKYDEGGDWNNFPPNVHRAIELGDHIKNNLGMKCDDNDIFFLGINARGKYVFMLTADI